jgi:membrane protein implicated in regulation of membrane protease activity
VRPSQPVIIGGVILALAIIGLFVLPDPWRVIFLVCAALIEVGEVFLWIRFLRRYRVTTGAEGMIGERAQVIGPGRVRVRGEIWSARGDAGEGETVRVAAVDGLTLVVEPEPRA